VVTRTRFTLLSRSNLHNKVLWLLVLNFTGSPINPPSRCSQLVSESFSSYGTNRPKRWILRERGWWSTTRRRSPSSTSQEMTSPLTLARVTRRRTGRRGGASRGSSTMTAMNLLLHQETTMTTRLKRNRLIKTFHLIILVFISIPMLIFFQFLLVNLHTLMERTTLFGVTKCVVTYFLSIIVFGR
jgi:hypothetical protein